MSLMCSYLHDAFILLASGQKRNIFTDSAVTPPHALNLLLVRKYDYVSLDSFEYSNFNL